MREVAIMAADAVATIQWWCPTCELDVHAPFCSQCGERLASHRDLTLAGFLGNVLRGITNIDGRLIRSFRCLLLEPGALTVAYLRGQRKPYHAPLQLFFIINLGFFAAHALTQAKVFSATLDSHLHNQPWSDWAGPVVAQHLEDTHTTMEHYAPVFNSAVALHAKSLIVLMILPFALLPPIFFRRTKQPFVVHVVFSVHFYSFILLMLCAALAMSGLVEFAEGGVAISDTLDNVVTFSLMAGCAVYLFYATARVYGAKGASRIAIVSALTVATAATVLGYRFLLLLITLYST
jgi:hypothetical protein